MSEQRSVYSSRGRARRWLGLGAFGALALAGLVVASGRAVSNKEAEPSARVQDPPRRDESRPSIGVAPAPSSARARAAAGAQNQAHRATPASKSGASRVMTERPLSEERARLVVSAERELDRLEAQRPENFLAIFDMMRDEEPVDEKALEAGRRASHAYILARMRILQGMLRRFIDDPDSDHALETDALAHVDSEFRQTVDSLARDVPAMANIQELLTTTMLKTPSFAERSPEAE